MRMFTIRSLPAFGLAFMALFTTLQAQADEATSIRSPEWAQPVGDQFNLHQMTPTLYRSALPDSTAPVSYTHLTLPTSDLV